MNNILDMSDAKIVGMKDEARAAECLAMIQKVCRMYRCDLVPGITIHGTGVIQPSLTVLPRPIQVKQEG